MILGTEQLNHNVLWNFCYGVGRRGGDCYLAGLSRKEHNIHASVKMAVRRQVGS